LSKIGLFLGFSLLSSIELVDVLVRVCFILGRNRLSKSLRNEIDIDREKIKLLIDEHYLKLIGQIDDIEAKCNYESGDTNTSKSFNKNN